MWQPQLHREFEANLGAWVWFVWRACLITHEACVNSAPNYQGKQVYVGIRVLRGLITHMLTPEQKNCLLHTVDNLLLLCFCM